MLVGVPPAVGPVTGAAAFTAVAGGVGDMGGVGGLPDAAGIGSGSGGVSMRPTVTSASLESVLTAGILPVRPFSSAARNSAADWKRSAEIFASPWSRTFTTHSGRSARYWRAGVAEFVNCEWIMAIAVSPENGR